MSTTQQPEALAADHSEQNLEMVARWYMIDKDGMATLCTDREDAEKEAKNANMAWPHTAPHRAVQLVEVASVAASAGSEPVAVGLSDPFDALRWGANVAETLLSIGRAIGFGRAQQILGEQWEAAHDCAPRGRMGVTVKDEATCQMCGGKPYPGCNTEFQGEAACRFTHPSPPEGAGWISVDERLPEWAARDDTPCFINGKEVPPTLTSETVLVALKGGGVRTDKLTTIEGKSDGWWHTYGERVVAWQKTPPHPLVAERGSDG